MVKALASLALVLGSLGCLGKPAFPLADAGSEDDADPDATALPDAAPACIGRTSFPADLQIRRIAEVGDIDRRDNGTADDVVIIGRTGNGAGQAFAYLLQGHPQFTAQCYDRAYPFFQNHDVEPVDVWVGEASGDSLPDLLLLGRDTDVVPSEGMEVVLYAGDATRQPADRVVVTFPLMNPFQNPWGKTMDAPEPVYVMAWASSAPPIRHVFAGSLYPAQASIGVTSNPLAFGTVRGAAQPNDSPITSLPVQDVALHAVGDPQELVVFLTDAVFRIRHTPSTSGAAYEIGGTAALSPTQRYARFARRPVDIGGVMTSIGATPRPPFGYQIIRVAGDFATAPSVKDFTLGPDPSNSRDMAIGFVDSDARPDFIGLTAEGADLVLQVSTNMDFSQADVRADQVVELRMASLATAYGILAIGDFDGVASTADQILVVSTLPGVNPTKCFELRGGALVTCP